jgi:hypothetical protein
MRREDAGQPDALLVDLVEDRSRFGAVAIAASPLPRSTIRYA